MHSQYHTKQTVKCYVIHRAFSLAVTIQRKPTSELLILRSTRKREANITTSTRGPDTQTRLGVLGGTLADLGSALHASVCISNRFI